MIADTIRTILTNLPAFLCVAAVICATLIRRDQHWARRYLSWILLLAVGVDGLWAGLFHEVGVADIALGAVAVLAFWRSLSFQSAVALYAIIFYVGVTVGHFAQAFQNNDYAADNFGLLLALTIARAIALSILLWTAWKQSPSERPLEGDRASA